MNQGSGVKPGPLDRSSEASREIGDVTTTVVAHIWVNEEYRHLILDAPSPAPSAQAGQFFNLECPQTGEDRPFLRRPMSVYRADPVEGRIEFLYKITGAGTRGLASLQPGQNLRVLGPLGIGFSLQPQWRRIVVLGRGVGLATLAPLAELAAERGIGVTAILSARSPDHLMSTERFARIGAQIHTVCDSDRTSAVPDVERFLRDHVREHRPDAFFTCGSNRLMLLMQRLGRELGIAGEVAMEQQMACGLGMCFCCVRSFHTADGIESRRVCIEGPVFKLDEALSW
jgi:dihydroorotate dehydrogenase electron transfer subunit